MLKFRRLILFISFFLSLTIIYLGSLYEDIYVMILGVIFAWIVWIAMIVNELTEILN